MHFKNHIYQDSAGTHFPDSHLGDELDYTVDFQNYVEIPGTTVAAHWEVPKGLELVGYTTFATNTTTAKIRSLVVGVHKVVCTVTLGDGSSLQKISVPMLLSVFA